MTPLLLGGEASLTKHLQPYWDNTGRPSESAETEPVAILFPCLDDAGQPDLELTRQAFDSASRDIQRLLFVTSTAIYAPVYSQPGQSREKPARSLLGRHPISDAWCRLEIEMSRRFEKVGVQWRTLRAAPTPHTGGKDTWSQRLSRAFLAHPMGFGPPLQLLHGEDLVTALNLAQACFEQLPEVSHIVPRDAVPLRYALQLADVSRLPLPFTALWLLRRFLSLAGWAKVAPAKLDSYRFPATAHGGALDTLGFVPRHNSSSVAATLSASPTNAIDRIPSDPFGLDEALLHRLRRTLLKFLSRVYWRTETHGVQHLPQHGPAVLLGVHRGIIPFDAMLALDSVVESTGRIPRFLIHPSLLRFPFIGDLMRQLGGVVACRDNAEWVLDRGGIVGIFPEGVRGAFVSYRDAYRIQRFGRAEFARLALRYRAPLAPFVTLGSAEVLPIVTSFHWKWWKRLTGWPCLPIPATPVPLPVKWHTRFLAPISVDSDSEQSSYPKAAEKLSREVQSLLGAELRSMNKARQFWFWGHLQQTEKDS